MITYHLCISTESSPDIPSIISDALYTEIQYPLEYDILLPDYELKYYICKEHYGNHGFVVGNVYLVRNLDPAVLTLMCLKNIPTIEFHVKDHELMTSFPRKFKIGISESCKAELVDLVDKHRYS